MNYTTLLLTIADTECEFDARVTARYYPGFHSPDRLEPDEPAGHIIEDVEIEISKGVWVSVYDLLSDAQMDALGAELNQERREAQEDYAYEQWREQKIMGEL